MVDDQTFVIDRIVLETHLLEIHFATRANKSTFSDEFKKEWKQRIKVITKNTLIKGFWIFKAYNSRTSRVLKI